MRLCRVISKFSCFLSFPSFFFFFVCLFICFAALGAAAEVGEKSARAKLQPDHFNVSLRAAFLSLRGIWGKAERARARESRLPRARKLAIREKKRN